MNRIEKIRFIFTKSMRGIEIGPSYNPIVPKSEGWMVETIDHGTREELIKKYRSHNVDIDKIEDVDWVWTGTPLDEMIGGNRWGTYDYVIASHVIEHTPDLLGFLKSIEHLLKDGGILSLAIPDKRYCFDFFKPITLTADILYANRKGAKRHTKKTAFEHIAYSCAQNGVTTWAPYQTGQLSFVHNLKQAFDIFQGANENEKSVYLDFHNWSFVPSSFLLIMEELYALDQTLFKVVKTFPTEGCEFFVLLRKCVKLPTEDRESIELRRLELMKQVMREIAEQITLDEKDRHIQPLNTEIQNMALHIEDLSARLKEIDDSLGWMILSKFRTWRDKILRPNTTRRDIYDSAIKAIKYIQREGIKRSFRKIAQRKGRT
jgi:SAM-dependent methyltransferase